MNLSEMSLREKIGQMFMVGVMDEHHLKVVLKQYQVGGIIHFTRNGQTAKEAFEFIKKAKQLSDYPLFTTVDQEGGIVTRIKRGVTPISGQMAIAATGDVNNAEKLSSIMAEELTLLGMNMNLAPVVDVNVNPKNPVINVRSFGENPDTVSAYAKASLKGYKTHQMLAIAKHFPGHGDTTVDSHLDLPIVDHGMQRIEAIELKPFVEMIKAGIDGIMISHVMFKAIDSENPSILSYKVITELLREKLGFKGLILTDCMEMYAISKRYPSGSAAIASIKAGADILLYSSDLGMQIQSMEFVYNAVISGDLDVYLINKAVSRIIESKKNIKNDISDWSEIKAKLCKEEDIKTSKSIALDSITIIGDLPFEMKDACYLIPESDLLSAYFPKHINYETEDISDILNSNKSLLFYKTVDSIKYLIKKLDKERVVLIPLKSPYERIDGFTTLLTYEMSALAIEMLKEVIEGKIPKGKLPVSEVI